MAIQQFQTGLLRPSLAQQSTQIQTAEDATQEISIRERRKRLRDRGLRTSIFAGGGSIQTPNQGGFTPSATLGL